MARALSIFKRRHYPCFRPKRSSGKTQNDHDCAARSAARGASTRAPSRCPLGQSGPAWETFCAPSVGAAVAPRAPTRSHLRVGPKLSAGASPAPLRAPLRRGKGGDRKRFFPSRPTRHPWRFPRLLSPTRRVAYMLAPAPDVFERRGALHGLPCRRICAIARVRRHLPQQVQQPRARPGARCPAHTHAVPAAPSLRPLATCTREVSRGGGAGCLATPRASRLPPSAVYRSYMHRRRVFTLHARLKNAERRERVPARKKSFDPGF